MDRTVPAGAAILLDFIGDIEAPAGYDTLYGNAQKRYPWKLTSLTLGEVLKRGREWPRAHGSSACGRYQFMAGPRHTLAGLCSELGLRDEQVFDADLQDRLAYHLLKRRGYDAFMAGRIDAREFGNRLAMEWASLPVLADCDGARRRVKRGQSYYAGDGLNKSLVSPERVEAILAKAKAAGNAIPAEKPALPPAVAKDERSPVPAPQHPPEAERAPAAVPEAQQPDDPSLVNWMAVIFVAVLILVGLAAFFLAGQ
jgi:muramidase (phage lysozyme)